LLCNFFYYPKILASATVFSTKIEMLQCCVQLRMLCSQGAINADSFC
jgi:hypothetical protein